MTTKIKWTEEENKLLKWAARKICEKTLLAENQLVYTDNIY